MPNENFSTTFLMDFRIAEAFGVDAVKDTFNRAFNEWKDQYKYGTDLCIVCNMLCWYHYEHGNENLSKLYADYYYQVRTYCLDHYKGEQFNYFWRMTD